MPARQVDRLEPHRDAWRTSRIAGTRDAERSLLNRRVPTRMPAHTRIEHPTRIEPPRELVSRPDVDDRVGGDQ